MLGDSHPMTPCNTQHHQDSCGHLPKAQSLLAHLDLCGSGAPPKIHGETDPLQQDISKTLLRLTAQLQKCYWHSEEREMETHDQEESRVVKPGLFNSFSTD